MQIFLGIILIVSGVSKVVDPEKSISLIIEMNILQEQLIAASVSFLIVSELFTGVLLIIGVYSKYVSFFAFFLFSLFFLISIYGAYMGVNSECGCFGSLIESRIGVGMILRNSIFVAVCMYVFIRKAKIKK